MNITLRAARINRGLTQKEAAKIIGISEYTLMSYEKGATFPDIPTLKSIEKAYGVKYDDIIFLNQNTV